MTRASTSADRHEVVSRLFLEACELPRDNRAHFIRNECDDDSIRSQVLEMLELDEQRAVVDEPVIRLSGSHVTDESAAPPCALPQSIGRYEILGVLGQGGMGIVYRARQDHPERIVALKVIRPGVASQSMIRRFELETRVLGRLHHPGIAQIYDAGAADTDLGTQPYFAMELITGATLIEYAGARRLDARERLKLLASVCDAVQHAHQHGIVHRDLKPANIIVDETGQPKILDFGVARMTDTDIKTTTVNTVADQLIGTLPYMSPEQVAGDPIAVDFRSDVYTLGVLAFELLAGRLPHDLADLPVLETARVIQNDPPTRLSSINRTLRGDVETIVGKAMNKEKELRYASAAELAGDIRRFLCFEPLVARPPSAIYHLRKFARRNRALVTGAVVAFVLLIVAVAGTSYGLIVARAERDDAQRAADKAEAVRQFFLSVLATPAPGVLGRDVKVVDALDAAEEAVASSFPDQPEIRADVYAEMAYTLTGLGEYERAERHARECLRIRSDTLGDHHIATLRAMNALGHVLLQPNRLEDPSARTEARRLLENALFSARSNDEVDRELLVSLINNRASLAYGEEDFDQAEILTREMLEVAMRNFGASSQQVISARQNLAMLLNARGQNAEAAAELGQVERLLIETSGPEHPTTLAAARAYAAALRELERYDEAEAIYLRCIPLVIVVFGDTHPMVVQWTNDHAFLLSRMQRRDEAVELYRDALRRAEASLGPSTFLPIVIKDSLAISLVTLGELEEAESLFRDCISGLIALQGAAAESTLREGYKLVDVLLQRGKVDEATEASRRYLITASEHFSTDAPILIIARSGVARSLLAATRFDEAQNVIEDCIRDMPEVSSDAHYLVIDSIKDLAAACERAGLTEAAQLLRDKPNS